MPPKAKEHPILVAIIGAIAAIIVGYLGYLGVTGGFSDASFDYTGFVQDSGKHAVAYAKVTIAEDQKVPQHTSTDSEGVFHVRLLKKTVHVHIDVQADGFQPYSLTVQPTRTGTEVITLVREMPPTPSASEPTSHKDIESDLPKDKTKSVADSVYEDARSFLKAQMTPAIPFPRSTDCCIESYKYAFVTLNHCELSFREQVEITHSDNKPDELQINNISIDLGSLPDDGISDGPSILMPDYNQIMFKDLTKKALDIQDIATGYPVRHYAQRVFFIENALDDEQDAFVKNLQAISQSCKQND